MYSVQLDWKFTRDALNSFYRIGQQYSCAHFSRFKNYLNNNYKKTCLLTGFISNGEQQVRKGTFKQILLPRTRGGIF